MEILDITDRVAGLVEPPNLGFLHGEIWWFFDEIKERRDEKKEWRCAGYWFSLEAKREGRSVMIASLEEPTKWNGSWGWFGGSPIRRQWAREGMDTEAARCSLVVSTSRGGEAFDNGGR